MGVCQVPSSVLGASHMASPFSLTVCLSDEENGPQGRDVMHECSSPFSAGNKQVRRQGPGKGLGKRAESL